jgi:hypothetical protein
MLKAVEKRLGDLKVAQLALPDLALPDEIEQMMANGGYGSAAGEGAVDPDLAQHLEQLKGDVKTLGVLEFQLQTHFLRQQRKAACEDMEVEEQVGGLGVLEGHDTTGYQVQHKKNSS